MWRGKMRRIKWGDREFLLVGNHEESGALATEEQLKNFLPSEAYLSIEGDIWKDGEKIGLKEDLVFLEEE